jgi:hypothetical protein
MHIHSHKILSLVFRELEILHHLGWDSQLPNFILEIMALQIKKKKINA